MHIFFSEIEKIINCLGPKRCSRKKTELCLSKICEKIGDDVYDELYKDYTCNKNDYVTLFESIFDVVAQKCSDDACDECPIRKWCNHYRFIQQHNEEEREGFTYADFFCGAGGLSLGFHKEGFKLSLANDIQECCIDTYSFNHCSTPSKHIIAGDINAVIANVSEYSRYKNIDVVMGGPPCQGFSMANRQRVIDDPRNVLYKSYIKAIAKLNPKWIVMENVKGILSVKDQIIEDFNNVGYSVSAHLINAKDFGVPQNRERVIFIGNRVGIDSELAFEKLFEYAEAVPSYTLADALAGLSSLKAKTVPNRTEDEDEESGFTFSKNKHSDSAYITSINDVDSLLCFNHKARYNNERDIEIFSRLNPGDNSADPKIADIMPYKRREKIFKDKYYKLEPDKVCKTITAHMKYDCNMYIHPYEARGLTPREAARVQSYPDDYYFRGSFTKTYMQVGNSVPPLLSKYIAKVIKEFLEVN